MEGFHCNKMEAATSVGDHRIGTDRPKWAARSGLSLTFDKKTAASGAKL
jgi:hypothetical protein